MAYLHEVEFVIGSDQLDMLRIGASLERVLGYLRTLLPNMPGYISAQAFTTVENSDQVSVLVTSLWEDWSDLKAHEQSAFAEEKILKEFEPEIQLADLKVTVYKEVD